MNLTGTSVRSGFGLSYRVSASGRRCSVRSSPLSTRSANLRAFLETDVERNVELYESFGFVVTSREDIVGATTRFTWRDTTNRTGDPFHALSASDAVHRLGGGADRRRSR